MKQWMALAFALVVAMLTSCGGGGGGLASIGGSVGSGGTGISGGGVGYVAGFGSIYVNGTRFGVDSATLTLADETALKLGMTVKVTGSLMSDFLTGTATSVESGIDTRGPVSSLNVSSGTFQVQGLNISTDSETIYEGVTALAGLANADWVKIYGQVWGAGNVRASRIEKLATADTLILSGTVANLDTINHTFNLGNLSIQYGSAVFSGAVDSSSISNGMLVRVRTATAPSGGVLVASSIQTWYPMVLTNSNALSIAGVITNYNSVANSFMVLGYPVDASAALITGGPSTAMGNGVKVEVAGLVQGGSLKASMIKIRQIPGTGGPANFIATGAISQFASAASFRVQGQPVDASGAVTFSGGTSSNLANAVKVTVVGSHVVNGVLIADTVTFIP